MLKELETQEQIIKKKKELKHQEKRRKSKLNKRTSRKESIISRRESTFTIEDSEYYGINDDSSEASGMTLSEISEETSDGEY